MKIIIYCNSKKIGSCTFKNNVCSFVTIWDFCLSLTYNIHFLHCNVVDVKAFGRAFKAANYCTCIQLYVKFIHIDSCSNKFTILMNQWKSLPKCGSLNLRHIFLCLMITSYMKERNSVDLFFFHAAPMSFWGLFFFTFFLFFNFL